MTVTLATSLDLSEFARRLRYSGPFESDRVSDAADAMPPSVPTIHALEFEELVHLVNQVQGHTGMGTVLWGEPGVGKSHLLARLWHDPRSKACVASLHNVQTSPERLPRYVLKCVVGQLARRSAGGLRDGELNRLIAAAVHRSTGSLASATMSTVHVAFQNAFIKPAIAAGRPDQELAFEFLFAYFRALYRARQSEDPSPPAACLALRWLTGDVLDDDEIAAVGLPPEVRGKATSSLQDDQAVEAVLSAISQLAASVPRTFVLLFDQADNLTDEQVSAWTRFAHALIDHVPNLLVVTSGVQGRLLEMEQSSYVNAASWDRIAQHQIVIHRITPTETRELLETRLKPFIEPFLELPAIEEHVCEDRLFPLGTAWLDDRIGIALDIRPRDAIKWARERLREIDREIQRTNVEEWLAKWPERPRVAIVAHEPLTSEAQEGQVDAKVEVKLAEQRRRRQLNPESLPADASNLLGLIEQLLAQCVDTQHGYSVQSVTRPKPTKRQRKPAYDLLVEEKSVDGQLVTTGIKFVATGSKTSTCATLRRLVAVDEPAHHTLVVTEERCPLQLGPKGREYLGHLQARGADAFGCRELTFDAHVQLDALQAVVGQARSGDLEITTAGGSTKAVSAEEVIESHHRHGRFLGHEFLCELLTEESFQPSGTPGALAEEGPVDEELGPFIMSQIALAGGVSTPALADKYVADYGLDASQADAVCRRLERAVTALHQAGKVAAVPQDEHIFVSMPDDCPTNGVDDRENTGPWMESTVDECITQPSDHKSPTKADVSFLDDIENKRCDSCDSTVTPSDPVVNSRGSSSDSHRGIPENALFLGNGKDGNAVELPLDMLPSHIALVGAAGSGKTWMAKVVAEEAIRQGVPVIAIDPQGDLVQFLRKTNDLPKSDRKIHDDYWNRVEPRVFTPGSSHGTRVTIDPIRLPSDAELHGVGDETRREEERQRILSAIVSNLANLLKAGGDIDMHRTFLMQIVQALLMKRSAEGAELHLREVAAAVMAPDSVGMDDADMYIPKSQRLKLGRKVMTLLKGPRAKLFRGGQPLNIDDYCQPSVEGKTPLNVFYLNALENDEEKQFFVAALATELYRWMVSSLESSGQAKLLVYLDEARDFIPAGASKPLAKESLIRLFSQGRKYGVSCLVCTQSPRSVDYNIFSNCSTKLIGRLESAQDVSRVAEWFSTDGGRPSWIAGRKNASRGTFVARWPDMHASLAGRPFKGRPLFSLHEGAWSPDRLEYETGEVE